jgi:hypothetical protein
MTQVNMGDEVIETDLPADKVADLQQSEADPTPEPQEPEKQPEPTAEPEQVQEPAKPEAVVPTTEPVAERPKKAGPIADLLEKKHEADERAAQAEARNAELEAQIAELSQQSPSVQTEDDIRAFAEANGLDESIVNGLVQLARKGLSPEIPKEVQELLAERQAEKQQKEELTAFNKRVDSLAKTLPNEQFNDPQVKEKLLKLAYSTEKAPDGEPYYQKELSEIYFAYIKPEVEPGKVSAESKGGGKSGGEILDFDAIMNDEAKMEEFAKTAPVAQWQAFVKFRDEKQGDTKIVRRSV